MDRAESCGDGAVMEKKETKWEYSAPSVPTSHWIDRGFDENYIQGMEVFLHMIKDSTCVLRSGACPQNLFFGGRPGQGGTNTVLLHDDILLPHWQEFANALQLFQNFGDLHRFCIHKVQLSPSIISLLAPALKDKPFETFALDNTAFVNAREGIDFAIEIIQSNQRLNKFAWANNPIESMDDTTRFVDAIISHPLIDTIRLVNCFGENVDAYSILRSLLASNKQFSHIDLESNNMRTGGSTEIPDYLATNPPLEYLVLANNHLDNADAVLISRALKRNTNLQLLHLGQNDIADVGRDALCNAVFDSTSLNSVADSNQSCCIDGIGLDGDIFYNLCEESKVNRGRKIYSLLSSRNREGVNVQHLDSEFGEDDSLKFVPKVLESVHTYAGYMPPPRAAVHPLSVMYEVLRSWKMPTLYKNNGDLEG